MIARSFITVLILAGAVSCGRPGLLGRHMLSTPAQLPMGPPLGQLALQAQREAQTHGQVGVAAATEAEPENGAKPADWGPDSWQNSGWHAGGWYGGGFGGWDRGRNWDRWGGRWGGVWTQSQNTDGTGADITVADTQGAPTQPTTAAAEPTVTAQPVVLDTATVPEASQAEPAMQVPAATQP